MTLYELHRNFKMECDKLDAITSMPSFLPEEIDYFINVAIERFIKTRYSGLNAHSSGFQQSQKRSDDLRTVVKSKEYDSNSLVEIPEPNVTGVYAEYPPDYWIGLGETIWISYYKHITYPTEQDVLITKRGDVTECTIENIDSELNNSMSQYRLHNGVARPLRLLSDNKIILYTDGNYTIPNYTITYIFKPEKIDFYAHQEFSEANTYLIGDKVIYQGRQYVCTVPEWNHLRFNITGWKEIELTVMPDHTWDEITALAVRIAIENISDGRYQTYISESQVIE